MSTIIKRGKETFEVRNEQIEVESDFRFDVVTGEKVSDNYLDNIAIQKAFEVYRKQHDIITKDEMVEIRNKYDLSQRAFATLTGIGVASIARYETGQIPTNANNELLKSIRDDFRIVQNLFVQNGSDLSEKNQEKLKVKLNRIIKENETVEVVEFVERRAKYNSPSIYSGYKVFDFDKFKHLVLYFSEQINYLSKTKLNKLLFYSDFKFFQEETVSITGLTYQHDYYGPVPKDFELLYAALEESEDIDWRLFPSAQGEYIENKTTFNSDLFTKEEIETLHTVLKSFEKDNAHVVSEKSHEEQAYIETQMKEKIPYHYADTLKHL